MARKQGELAGMETPHVEEIDTAAEAYRKLATKHSKLTKELKSAKTGLIDLIKKHKKDAYRLEDGSILSLKKGAEGVQIVEGDNEVEDEEGEEKS